MKIEWHDSINVHCSDLQVCGTPAFGAGVQKSMRTGKWSAVVIIDNNIVLTDLTDSIAEAKKSCETVLIERCKEMGIEFPEYRE